MTSIPGWPNWACSPFTRRSRRCAGPPDQRRSTSRQLVKRRGHSGYAPGSPYSTLAILIYHNLFGRFPGLQVASVENGSIWVPYLLRVMDTMKGMARNGPWPGGYVEGRPSEIFKRHVYVSPHHYGEDVGGLIDLLGAERVLFGSDFPHGEGMSAEDDYRERAGEFAAALGRPEDQTRLVMRQNGMRMLGLVE